MAAQITVTEPETNAEDRPEAVASVPRSRRAVLAAAGGAAAAVVAALSRPGRAEAAAGSNLIIGSALNNAGTQNTVLSTNSTVVAFQLLQNGPGTALMGYATPLTGGTRGVYGRTDSPNGDGVQGRNAGASTGTGTGVHGYGGHGVGVWGESDQVAGVYGSSSSFAGVSGFGTSVADGVHGTAGAGVGVAGQSTNSYGVYASSTNGIGLLAQGSNGAGLFLGSVQMNSYLDMAELGGAAGTPNADRVRIFARDNGATKTQLCVQFSSGSVIVLATQV